MAGAAGIDAEALRRSRQHLNASGAFAHRALDPLSVLRSHVVEHRGIVQENQEKSTRPMQKYLRGMSIVLALNIVYVLERRAWTYPT
jgi:hypothetical protein